MWRSTAVRSVIVAAHRYRRDAAGRLGALRQLLEGWCPVDGISDGGERRRDLDRGNANAIRPGRERVVWNARRCRRPEVARRLLEVRRIGMVVDIADEQDADRALFLRRQRFSPRRRRFRGDDTFKGTLRIALAGLVIEHHHDGAA